jgi:hypothetical protein
MSSLHDPFYAKLALQRFTRYGIQKQASPREHFFEPTSSAVGLFEK